MSLYIQMPVIECRYEFETLLAEYGKIKALIAEKEQRLMQIECALSALADKAFEAMDEESEERSHETESEAEK